MNMGSHSISKQCDIIVFDSSKIPVIFRDDDFVVVRPESVRAVIEVKGTANKKEIDGLLDSFLDFGKKWRDCQLFYHEHHQPLARRPSLYAMCWSVGLDTRGRPLTNGTKIRKQIASFYNANAGLASMKGFPRLEKLFVYNECGVSESGWTEANSEKIEMGFATERGRFVRYDPAGVPYLGGDRTIASLLAGLHYAVGDDFNRFYSYVDEARQSQTPRYEHQGFSAWLPETASMRDANANLIFAAK
jgi:hypothetical protein